MKRWTAAVWVLMLVLSMLTVSAAEGETRIVLSDSGTTVDGAAISRDSSAAVYEGAAIVYYEAGKGSDYGEGTEADEHSAAEAAAHTVVTITAPGTYRVSGSLSAGQLAIDLGADAVDDPEAVVTIVLDGVDITCSVAPAVIFYNVYECGAVDIESASGIVDTSAAGANVVLADGSQNDVNGSYVARIYREGSTKKLHKYDGAFYAKMSMNISGEALGTGELHIVAANEGLDSELHLTINGGNIWIEAQDDGVNTNEDYVSVTTINGGYLWVNGGLGAEGDGIDSNGYLTINGGTVIAQSHPMADGGIDADGDILINGGTVIAFGGRNDAVSSESAQEYMELSFASRKQAGTVLHIESAAGEELLSFKPVRDYQSLTISSAELEKDAVYHIYVGGSVRDAAETDGLYQLGGTYQGGSQQQYSGNRQGGFGGGWPMGEPPQGFEPPEGFDPGQMPQPPSGEMREMRETREPGEMGEPPQGFEGPEGFDPGQLQEGFRGGFEGERGARQDTLPTSEGSIDFMLTATIHSFSGVADWVSGSGKTAVHFLVNEGEGIANSGTPTLEKVTVLDQSGSVVAVPSEDVQLTVSDLPSESYNESCMLSAGAEGFAALLPTETGNYRLTISVLSSNESYTGTSQFDFSVGSVDAREGIEGIEAIESIEDIEMIDAIDLIETETTVSLPFADVANGDPFYEAIRFVYERGLMTGTAEEQFSPQSSVSRAMAVTVLGRLTGSEAVAAAAFSDVEPDSWYSAYVGWAAAHGIVAGYGGGLFGPDDAVTRQQICAILSNYAEYAGIELSSSGFAWGDAADVADWAAASVQACYASGLLEGIVSDDAFLPNAPLKRAEFADLIMRFAELIA